MGKRFSKKAVLFDMDANGIAVCRLCRHMCRVAPDKTGICGVRKNNGKFLETLVFGRVAACNADPIEKKPLFHLMPGTTSFSVATVGCNFRCSFCQNHSLSQASHKNMRGAAQLSGSWLSPSGIVSEAIKYGAKSIAYTYSEPTIFFEYAYETAKLAHEKGLLNVFVSNGYMTREAIDIIQPYLDGINIDLKAFREETYKAVCGAHLDGVLDTIRYVKSKNIWQEITTLVVSGMNDSEGELRDIASFIVSVGKEIPWHISRFHPDFNMTDRPPTNPDTLIKAVAIGKDAGLKYIFTGNLYNPAGEDTVCPGCGKRVIQRRGFSIIGMDVEKGSCRFCGETIEGVWEAVKS